MATLGQKLKAAREAKGITESDAGRATKILTKLIISMESDDFSDMTVPIYAKGFIRLYANYLGIDPQPLVEEYIQKHAPGPKPLIDEESQLQKNTQGKSFSLNLDWLPKNIGTPAWIRSVPDVFSKVWKKPPRLPAKDIRLIAAGAAALIILIVLAVSISNCARRRSAEKSAPPAPVKEARSLLDEPLPDLYLVEPGKIESSR